MRDRMSLAMVYTRFPSSVKMTFLRAPRSMRQVFNTSSRVRMCMLTVDWVRCRSSAALVKLQYSAVATKTSS